MGGFSQGTAVRAEPPPPSSMGGLPGAQVRTFGASFTGGFPSSALPSALAGAEAYPGEVQKGCVLFRHSLSILPLYVQPLESTALLGPLGMVGTDC